MVLILKLEKELFVFIEVEVEIIDITLVDKTIASHKVFHEMGLSFQVQYYFWERLLGQRGVDKYPLLIET